MFYYTQTILIITSNIVFLVMFQSSQQLLQQKSMYNRQNIYLYIENIKDSFNTICIHEVYNAMICIVIKYMRFLTKNNFIPSKSIQRLNLNQVSKHNKTTKELKQLKILSLKYCSLKSLLEQKVTIINQSKKLQVYFFKKDKLTSNHQNHKMGKKFKQHQNDDFFFNENSSNSSDGYLNKQNYLESFHQDSLLFSEYNDTPNAQDQNRTQNPYSDILQIRHSSDPNDHQSNHSSSINKNSLSLKSMQTKKYSDKLQSSSDASRGYIHTRGKRRPKSQKNKLQSLSRGYFTKNYLQYAKRPHIDFIIAKIGKRFLKSNAFLIQIMKKKGMCMLDYQTLYRMEQLKEIWAQFFRKKILYRDLILSRSLFASKLVFCKFLYRFQEAYQTGIFIGISRQIDQNEQLPTQIGYSYI